MYIKSECPCCGAYTAVQLTREESKLFQMFGITPTDFQERSVCPCCFDDGYRFVDYSKCYRVVASYSKE